MNKQGNWEDFFPSKVFTNSHTHRAESSLLVSAALLRNVIKCFPHLSLRKITFSGKNSKEEKHSCTLISFKCLLWELVLFRKVGIFSPYFWHHHPGASFPLICSNRNTTCWRALCVWNEGVHRATRMRDSHHTCPTPSCCPRRGQMIQLIF